MAEEAIGKILLPYLLEVVLLLLSQTSEDFELEGILVEELDMDMDGKIICVHTYDINRKLIRFSRRSR